MEKLRSRTEIEISEILTIQSEMAELIRSHILSGEPIVVPDYVERLIERSDRWWDKQDDR